MAEVKLKENESLDNALRRFKKQCARSGILTEVKRREHYEKPLTAALSEKKARQLTNEAARLVLDLLLQGGDDR